LKFLILQKIKINI